MKVLILLSLLIAMASSAELNSPTELMSPNYPNSYPNNTEETWLLTVHNGSAIFLEFQSFHVRLLTESI